MNRSEVFARDGHRCAYCGEVREPDDLSVDHVQPRMRGGDGSPGNVLTACKGCNTRKGSRPLAEFLAEELARRGVVDAPSELVEGVRGLRSSEAIADVLLRHDPPADSAGGSPSHTGPVPFDRDSPP